MFTNSGRNLRMWGMKEVNYWLTFSELAWVWSCLEDRWGGPADGFMAILSSVGSVLSNTHAGLSEGCISLCADFSMNYQIEINIKCGLCWLKVEDRLRVPWGDGLDSLIVPTTIHWRGNSFGIKNSSIQVEAPFPPLPKKKLEKELIPKVVSSEYRTYLKQSLTFLGFKFIYSLHIQLQQLLYF